jgi:hypothetical protein
MERSHLVAEAKIQNNSVRASLSPNIRFTIMFETK